MCSLGPRIRYIIFLLKTLLRKPYNFWNLMFLVVTKKNNIYFAPKSHSLLGGKPFKGRVWSTIVRHSFRLLYLPTPTAISYIAKFLGCSTYRRPPYSNNLNWSIRPGPSNISWSSWSFLILRTSFSHNYPYILPSTSLSHSFSILSLSLWNSHISQPYDTTGLMTLLHSALTYYLIIWGRLVVIYY